MPRLPSCTTWTACAALAAGLALSPQPLVAGDVTGRIEFVGDVPTLDPKVAKGDPNAKDPTVCAVHGIPNYTVTINPSDKGVADVFVWVRRPSSVDPALAKAPTDPIVVDQKECQFIPHAQVVRTGQQVIAKSQDAVPHNIHGYNVFNPGFNFTVPANDREGQKVEIAKANAKAEPVPIPVKCDIHTHMESYWLVVDHPYAAVSDANGKFTIKGLPAGKHSLTVWHSTAGYLNKALEVDVPATADEVGLPTIKVQAVMAGGKFQKLAPAP
jgi:hypothetical protein